MGAGQGPCSAHSTGLEIHPSAPIPQDTAPAAAAAPAVTPEAKLELPFCLVAPSFLFCLIPVGFKKTYPAAVRKTAAKIVLHLIDQNLSQLLDDL